MRPRNTCACNLNVYFNSCTRLYGLFSLPPSHTHVRCSRFQHTAARKRHTIPSRYGLQAAARTERMMHSKTYARGQMHGMQSPRHTRETCVLARSSVLNRDVIFVRRKYDVCTSCHCCGSCCATKLWRWLCVPNMQQLAVFCVVLNKHDLLCDLPQCQTIF